jgi:diguanylate cyclase (GGDEF)-like protein
VKKTVFFLLIYTLSLSAQTLVFGIFSYRSSQELMKEYQPIATHLAHELKATIVIKPLLQHDLERQIQEGKIDIILTNPTHLLWLRTQKKVTPPLVTLLKQYGLHTTSSFGGVIITSASQRTIRTLLDLAGKTIAIHDKTSLGGYQSQRYELYQAGIDSDEAFRTVSYPNDAAIIEAILSGHADAGFLRTGVLEEMIQKHLLNPAHLLILNPHHYPSFPLQISTTLYPECSVVASQKLPPKTVMRIAIALYGYHTTTQGGFNTIVGFSIPDDHNEVTNLAKTLQLPPYNYPLALSLPDIWEHYKIIIVIFVAVLFLFAFIWRRLYKKTRFEQHYAHSILNAINHPIVIVDKKTVISTNQALLKFFGLPSYDVFKEKYNDIGNFFEEDDIDTYLLSTMDDLSWIEYILTYPEYEHKIKITHNQKITRFKLELSLVNDPKIFRAIITFTDISSLVDQSTTDPLTKVANRFHFNLLLKHALHRTQREKTPLSFIFFDVDQFKKINDLHSYLIGDEVLRHIAFIIKNSLRKSDIIARWGGEEFMILLPNTPANFAAQVAQKLRKTIEDQMFNVVGHVTCSFGVTQLREEEEENSLLERLDELLKSAQRGGCNRVVIGY